MSSESEHNSQLYCRILLPCRQGCALWIPEPNYDLPPDHWQIGVQIGDVGLITEDGGFDYIFNACKPADHALNQRNGVPEGFSPLLWDGKQKYTPVIFRPNEAVFSQGGTEMDLSLEADAALFGLPASIGGGLGVSFDRSKGAVVMPGVHGASRVDSENKRVFREYALRNGIAWYEFVNGPLGREAGNGEIYLITGVDKTNSWELAVAQNSSSKIHCQFVFTASAVGGGGLKLSRSIRNNTRLSSRISTDEDHHNQTLFVRGYRVSIRLGLSGMLMSKVKVTATYPPSLMDRWARSFVGGASSLGESSLSTTTSGASEQSLGHSSSGSSRRVEAAPAESDHSSEDNTASVCETALDDETGSEYEDIEPKMFHPLMSINDYILETDARVEVVATHDDDLIALLDDEQDYNCDGVPPTDTLISRLNERMTTVVDDLGHAIIVPKGRTILSLPDLIVQKIFSHLPHSDLLACSLICCKFVFPTRHLLFHSITIRDLSLLEDMSRPHATLFRSHCVKEVKIAGFWNEVLEWESNATTKNTISDILCDAESVEIDNWSYPLRAEVMHRLPGISWSSVRRLKISNMGFEWYGHVLDIVGVFTSTEQLELDHLSLGQTPKSDIQAQETHPEVSLHSVLSMKLDVDPGVIEHLVPSPRLQKLECKIPLGQVFHPYIGKSIGKLVSSAGDSLEVVVLKAEKWSMGEDLAASKSFNFIKFDKNPNIRELRLSVPATTYLIPFLEALGATSPRKLDIIYIRHLLGYEIDWTRLDTLLVSSQFPALRSLESQVQRSIKDQDIKEPENWLEAASLKAKLPSLSSRGFIKFLPESLSISGAVPRKHRQRGVFAR